MERCGRHHFNQATKLGIINRRAGWHMPPSVTQRKYTALPVWSVLVPTVQPESNCMARPDPSRQNIQVIKEQVK